jgi:hypothetical protein
MKPRILPVLITFSVLCFALVQNTRAVSPAPDGGYPGGNTAEGTDALFSLTNGAWNTALGAQTLNHNTTGGGNTAAGFQALLNNTTGNHNTAYGAQALFSNGSNRPGSSDNTATGYRALYLNADGEKNTANGAYALNGNTEGVGNTAIGYGALAQNQLGNGNTATGYQALNSNNFEAGANTATGYQALFKNTDACCNTATGTQALFNNTGGGNMANGERALYNNTTGGGNTANGFGALISNTIGGSNTANGFNALVANTTGGGNTAIGTSAGTNVSTADHVICIGADVAGADVSNTTWIGGVYGVTTQSGTTAPVVVSDTGQLGTAASSERFKKDVNTMEKASEAILALRPVTFHYKTDTKGIPQFGLIAEEVAKVNPALVLPDKEGKPYTVRYDAVNAMLLNEFLKEHRKVERLEATVAQQHKDFEAAVAELKGQIQRVSAQLELSKSAPQTVLNNQ